MITALVTLVSLFSSWLRLLWQALNDWFWWALETTRLYLIQLLEAGFDYLPESMQPAVQAVADAIMVADYWTGFLGALGWVVVYWGFAVWFGVLKIVVKLIPTIG